MIFTIKISIMDILMLKIYLHYYKENLFFHLYGHSVHQLIQQIEKKYNHKLNFYYLVLLRLKIMIRKKFHILKETHYLIIIMLLRKDPLQDLLINGFYGQILLILIKKYQKVFSHNKLL